MQGIVKKLIRERGFGFIRGEDGAEVFFHRTSLQNLKFDSLKEGEKVRYELQQGEKGARAVGVQAT